MLVYTSGHSVNSEGEKYHFKHDQTGARLGEYRLKSIHRVDKIHELPNKSSHSLYVYK